MDDHRRALQAFKEDLQRAEEQLGLRNLRDSLVFFFFFFNGVSLLFFFFLLGVLRFFSCVFFNGGFIGVFIGFILGFATVCIGFYFVLPGIDWGVLGFYQGFTRVLS